MHEVAIEEEKKWPPQWQVNARPNALRHNSRDLDRPRDHWRIVLISAVLPVVEQLVPYLRELGHEPVAWLMPRRAAGNDRPLPPWGEVTDSKAPDGINLLFAQDKWAVAPLLRGLEPDLVLCHGFSWKLPQEALDVPRLGSVNQHPAQAASPPWADSAGLGAPRRRR